MDFGTVGSVIGITVICYLVALAVRATPLKEEWLPVICGGLGIVLGILGFLFMPDYPAGDFISAAAVGVVSGLAATGTHQVYKQVIAKKGKTEKADGQEKPEEKEKESAG